MSIIIYGIPTCNSCKKSLQWLKERGIEHKWVDTRKTPPSTEKVTSWVQQIGSKPMKNTSGGSYRALSDEKKTWGDAEWILAFSKDPMLLKRPLVERDGTALFTGTKGFTEDFFAQLKG